MPFPRALLVSLVTGLVPSQQEPQSLAARVDAYLEPLVAMKLWSGAVLLARGGEILLQQGHGFAELEGQLPNRADTRFKLMSVSKPITAVAVMRLVQDGRLSLTDRVADHLDGWPVGWRGVTVHDLLDHTSGIPNLEVEWCVAQGDERGLPAWPEFARQHYAAPLAARPGTDHRYSNFNYVLLGLLVEAVSGRAFPEQVKAAVLQPAGMSSAGIDDGSRFPGLAIGYSRGADGQPLASSQDMSRIGPAGGFYGTVGDLYRLDRALVSGELLTAAQRTAMLTPRVGSYACGWVIQQVHGRPCVQHSGGANGYVADFLRFPEDDACVVALSNFAYAPIVRVSHDLAAILFGDDVQPARQVDAAALAACTGVYRQAGSHRRLLVRRSGNALLTFDVVPGVARCGGRLLVPVGDRTFAPALGEGRLLFEPAAEGRPARIRRRSGDEETELLREKVPPWNEAVGDWTAEPPLGSRVRIVDDAGRLLLRIEEGWPAEVELVAVGDALAIALYDATGGTLLHRDGNGLRWQRADGMEFRLRRP